MSNNFPLEMFDAQAPVGTVRHVFARIKVRCDQPLTLIMKHAGFTNEAYIDARRKLDLELQAFGDRVPPQVLIDRMIPLFAQYVVVGWENAIGVDGKTPIPFSADEVEACLRAIAHKNRDMVMEAFAHAAPADNFRPLVETLGNG